MAYIHNPTEISKKIVEKLHSISLKIKKNKWSQNVHGTHNSHKKISHIIVKIRTSIKILIRKCLLWLSF